ncbi:BRCT domain-containing protein [Naegleria gruberi]|uniref:BRCT domain-containing protein n=1 Tax=Naegleria gruberi TaxID=5762 RepID=D2VRT7_NAEGR|nr:BRCT domain-containing protein [Naegleria gruberi]EFC40522.1 BRCT domain-containing protein [Naegleria gruberi]|eukprot:XP_002673266.1 BRCT domain-containing protein [Naegleria gruberi strain NEG-M]
MHGSSHDENKRKLSLGESSQEGSKKIKLSSSSSSSGLFGDLPNELVLQVISFLVGDLNDFYHNVDVTTIKRDPTQTATKRNLYDLSALEQGVSHLTKFIPTFDNIKALAKLSMVDKRTFELVTGKANDADLQFMERFWLQGFVFFQKLAYWIRTDTIDNLQLGCGDLNRRQIEEMGRIQNVVQAVERGKPLDDLESAVDKENSWMDDMSDGGDDDEEEEEEEEEEDDFLDGDYCSDISKILPGVTIAISGIVNPERTTLRETAMKMGAKYTPEFQAGKTTHMIAAFSNTDKTKEAINAGIFVVSKQWVYDCSTLSKRMDERRYSMVAVPKPVKTTIKKKEKKKKTPSKTPLYSDEQVCTAMLKSRLDGFDIEFEDYETLFKPHRTAFEMFMTQSFILSLNMFNHMDSENNDEYWSEDNDVLLTSNYLESWADEQPAANPYRYRRTKHSGDDNSPKLGVKIEGTGGWANFITCDADNKKAAHTLTQADIKMDNIEKKLSKSIYLNLANVLYFTPLQNYSFPDSIRFLSIDYSASAAYKEYPNEEWKSFFNNCSFPGVRYLRLRCGEERYYHRKTDDKKEVMTAEETSKVIIESILNSKSLPKLEYLLLVGFSQYNYLEQQIDYLKQLYGIDIVFDYETRDHWKGMTKFTSHLSNERNSLLRYVVVETDLDSRNACDHNSIQEYYDSHNCPASIGRYSISRFYYSCNE